jgi:hypothetical protein
VFAKRISRGLSLPFALLLCAYAALGQTGRAPGVLPKWAHKENCAVRFVYNPPKADSPVTPLILRQTVAKDPRYGTWSSLYPEGLTQWISNQEMENLVEALEKLNLKWDVSEKPISFARVPIEPPPAPPKVPWKMPLARLRGTMEIDLTSDAGSAVADLHPEQVCGSMEQLDRAFYTPIAAYNFRGYRLSWGCEVPGFSLANRPEPPKHGPN